MIHAGPCGTAGDRTLPQPITTDSLAYFRQATADLSHARSIASMSSLIGRLSALVDMGTLTPETWRAAVDAAVETWRPVS